MIRAVSGHQGERESHQRGPWWALRAKLHSLLGCFKETFFNGVIYKCWYTRTVPERLALGPNPKRHLLKTQANDAASRTIVIVWKCSLLHYDWWTVTYGWSFKLAVRFEVLLWSKDSNLLFSRLRWIYGCSIVTQIDLFSRLFNMITSINR